MRGSTIYWIFITAFLCALTFVGAETERAIYRAAALITLGLFSRGREEELLAKEVGDGR